MKDYDFAGKLAIVTGGTRGIGLGIATALLGSGAAVALVGTDPERSAAVAEALAGKGTVQGYGCDVSDGEAVKSLVETVRAEMGEVDFLVNNAGITRDNLFVRMKDDEWEQVLSVNLGGAWRFSRALARPMMKRPGSRIINITSVVGQTGNAGQANYAASKAGLIGLTKSLAQELAPRQVTVNAVAPGFIQTDMTAAVPEEARQAIIDAVPMRSLGEVEDIAAAVLFLLSDGASYITGQVLGVNGGMVMMG